MPPNDRNFYGANSVGVGTEPPRSPDSSANKNSKADDFWPEQFDEYGNAVDNADDVLGSKAVKNADQEFFSDRQTGSGAREELLNRAKQNSNYSKSRLGNAAAKKIGGALGDEGMFSADSDASRQKAKEKLKQKARDKAKEKITSKIADEGVKKGLEKGLSKGAGSLAKEGAKKVAGKAMAEAGAKVGAKVGSKAAVGALQGAVDVGAAATGFETLGLGFLIGLLLNIAISLGVSDAVDAGFALKDGDIKQAYFLAVRAAAKVGMFIYLLICIGTIASIGGIFIGAPLLFFLNVYIILGFAFKRIPFFQGLVKWEIAIILVVDLFAFLILVAFIASIGYHLCSESGLGEGGIKGTVSGAIASVYDWWTRGDAGSVASDFCKYVGPTS